MRLSLSLSISPFVSTCVYVSGVVVVVELEYGVQVGGGGGSQKE